MDPNRTYAIALKILDENPGASSHVLADKIARAVTQRDDRVRLELNVGQFEEQIARARKGISCNHFKRDHHYKDAQRLPCPRACPVQAWPEWKFRRTIFGNWKLKE